LYSSNSSFSEVDLIGKKLSTAANMIRAARVMCEKSATLAPLGNLSTALTLVNEVREYHPTEADVFWSDIESLSQGFVCALLSNPTSITVGEPVNYEALAQSAIQQAFTLKDEIIKARKEMESRGESEEKPE
jgi:hypothetical protein